MPSKKSLAKAPVPLSKYSRRVTLKTILGRSDGGKALIGERVVIGGWVKSSNEAKNEPPPPPPPPPPSKKDVSCPEILRSPVHLFEWITKVLGGSPQPARKKRGSAIPEDPPPPPAPPTTPSEAAILRVSDGSCNANLQVMVDSSIVALSQVMPTGTCIFVEGILQLPAGQGKPETDTQKRKEKPVVELKVEKIIHLGTVDQDIYPLSKKRLGIEKLRDFPHFRPRTTTVASVTRICDALIQATHIFFTNNEFLNVQIPIITTTDSEGVSEKFQVTTLLRGGQKKEVITMDDTGGVSIETVKASIKEKSKQIDQLSRSDSNRETLALAIQDLHKTNELAANMEARERTLKSQTSVKTVWVDFSEDFFSRQAYLTVSGRLHLESYACSLGNVYSFGPRFHAEKLESKKCAAEMWMIELEMAFSELEDAMDCADDFLKFVCKWALENCSEDLKFLSKRVDETIVDRLQSMTSSSFQRVTYAQAVEVLKQVKDKKFEGEIEWGVSLTEEHESYLADEIYESPVIIYNYPKELKPFHVRLNTDGKTVAAFDVVVPKTGKLIRGSQSEERLALLTTRINEMNLPMEQYEWYLDLRRHGTIAHSGFSLTFDLLVLYATGMTDVRDVIPFPRTRGNASN